jgi:serine/threonine-protein kinase RsbW
MTGVGDAATLTLRLANRLDAIPGAAGEIERFCRSRGVPAKVVGQLNLVIDEAATNVIAYAWPGGGAHEFSVTVRVGVAAVTVEITDDGIAFDPLEVPPPELETAIEERKVGGLGVHFVRTLTDSVTYRRVGGRNELRFEKSYVPER